MRNSFFYIIVSLIFIACSNTESKLKLNYPSTKKINQTDNYFGTMVADPYRWLEDDNSEETKQWVIEQNNTTFAYLSKIPFREKIKERLSHIWNFPKQKAPFKAGSYYLFYKNDGLQNQDILYIIDSLNAEPVVFLDPNKLSEDGTISLNSVKASHDGKYLAYSISKGGSDWNEIFVMEIKSKQRLNDFVQWTKFTTICWFKDGFFYGKYDEPGTGKELTSANEYQKIYYHKIGTQQKDDSLICEDKQHPKRYFDAKVTEDEKYLILYPSEGAGGNNALYVKELAKPDAAFVPIVDNFENDYVVIDNFENFLLIKTNYNAPKYKLILIDPYNPAVSNWKDLIPTTEDVLESANFAGGKLIVKYAKDACSRLYVHDLKGNLENEIILPVLGNINTVEANKYDTQVFYLFSSFTYPPTIFKYDIKEKKSSTHYTSKIDFPIDDYETTQVFYNSKDGTKVPMFIVHKKNIVLDGNNPALLYAYGGFNISSTPEFKIPNLILLENGGVYAVANIRGGNEYGEEWHKNGMLFNKQNVFDDFIGAAEYLIEHKYTSPQKLAISGRSNGGLLVGAAMLQRPDIFKVALPGVGVMDMLRFHKFTIGWAWVSEYGHSEDSAHFKNLYSYSPLHNIKNNINYPATLVTTADHDDRVVPAHSFKFISELQSKYQGENPVLIRIDTQAGHGSGKPTSKLIEEHADIWSFVFYNFGITPNY